MLLEKEDRNDPLVLAVARRRRLINEVSELERGLASVKDGDNWLTLHVGDLAGVDIVLDGSIIRLRLIAVIAERRCELAALEAQLDRARNVGGVLAA